jgi:two-component system, LytTR family, response regulator
MLYETGGEYIAIEQELKIIEPLLHSNLFKRIHRSFIISLNKIESYTPDTIEINGMSIPVGRGYKDVFENLYFPFHF